MCGIAGVRRYGKVPISADEVKVLLQALEHRGNHATGIALMVDGVIEILKAPTPAWKFCQEDDTNAFLKEFLPKTSIALLHTRYASVGNPLNNDNNHPMFAGKTAVVHNGGVTNHQQMFNELKMDRSCETDSDVFRAVLDKEGMNLGAIRTMNKFSGSAAIAAMSVEEPDTLILARSGSPLVYGFTPDKIWWASEVQAIQKAVRPWEHMHGLWGRKFRSDVAYFGIPDNTAYILQGDNMGGRAEFKVCEHYRQPNYNMRSTFQSKQKEFKRTATQKTLGTGTDETAKFTHKTGFCTAATCRKGNCIPATEDFATYNCHACNHTLKALDKLKANELTYSIQKD